jgi:hypothetical protein
MKLRRLLQMGPTEVAVRSRQELSKRLERIGVVGHPGSRSGSILSRLSSDGVLAGISAQARDGNLDEPGRRLVDRFRETASARFFEGPVSAQTPALVENRMPGVLERVVAGADAICQGRFDLLGHRGLFFGDPVDWHLDPVSGRRAPVVHWSRLDPLDAAIGDCKVIWELNRHQWLVRLGQAYQLTGDERYAGAFARYVGEWLRANPPGLGINWTSSLELALRLISWCWALFLFRSSRALSPGLFLHMLGAIWAHAAHVERHLSYYFAPNAHLTGEALGLFYAGIVFPEWPRAGRWRTLGTKILVEECKRQILADGVYFEQSSCYQRYTVEIYLHFLVLARRNGVPAPPEVAERVQRMLDFLLAIRRPDGSIPQIGDADGGWLLPLADRAPDDLRGLFSTAAAAFGRPDCAWAAPAPAPESLWLLGRAGLDALEALDPGPPATAPARLFAEGGYAVIRSGWDTRAHQLIFDAGPLGGGRSVGHGHADLLSIQVSAFGAPYLVDPGTYCYTRDSEWRAYFRGTIAHSTVVVDGIGQAAPAGPFKWDSRPRARVRRWLSTEAFDFVDAEHDAYRRLSDPVLHRRRVLFVKPRYWVVVDDLEGATEHRVELRFQFGPMPVTVDSALWARAQGPGGHGLLVQPFATVPLKPEVREGELAPIQGWVAPDYGQRRPAPVLVYSAVTPLPLRIVTLLLPTEDPLATPPAVSPLLEDGAGPIGLSFAEWQESIHFDGPDGVTIRPSPRGRPHEP